ncbi:MAG: hypothetical protein AABY84_06100 [Candidatus Firestonebacteria bacterium]
MYGPNSCVKNEISHPNPKISKNEFASFFNVSKEKISLNKRRLFFIMLLSDNIKIAAVLNKKIFINMIEEEKGNIA